MPVEINELVIRAVVEPRSASAGTEAPEDAGVREAGAGGLSREQSEALVQAAVREVMKALRRAKER